MDVTFFDIEGPCLLTPAVYADDRGWFMEAFNHRQFCEKIGQSVDFVQDNHSLSVQIGTVRGLHYQSPPYAQDKLVRCIRGGIIDFAVDARKSSPTYGRSIRSELTAENRRQFFVPKGFLHGFITIQPDTEVGYKVSGYYQLGHDGSVHFSSPSLGLNEGRMRDDIHLSDKDRRAPRFEDWDSPFS